MTTSNQDAVCAKCGAFVDESADTEGVRAPCPACGSTERSFDKTVTVAAKAYLGVECKGKHPGARKYFVENRDRPKFSHNEDKLVREQRVIDRDNDRYSEAISDYESCEVIHSCNERLSAHWGHGSAKTKKDDS